MARRLPLRSTALLGGLLLVMAGMLQLVAAAIRWAPCFGPVETVDLGDGIMADACALAEDHARDYLWVSAPFEVTPGAVLLAGIASLLLAVFWLLWAVRLRGDPLGALLAVLSAAGWLVAGVPQLLAAASDGALGVLDPHPLVSLAVSLLALVVPVVAAVRAAVHTRRKAAAVALAAPAAQWASFFAWCAVALAAVVAFPLIDYVLLIDFSQSHDSPIGSSAPAAAVTMLAGCAFLVAAALGTSRRAPGSIVGMEIEVDRH